MTPEAPTPEIPYAKLEAQKPREEANLAEKFEVSGLKQSQERVDAALKANPDELVEPFKELIAALQKAESENQEVAGKVLKGLAEITGMEFTGNLSSNAEMLAAAAKESGQTKRITAILDMLEAGEITQNAKNEGMSLQPKFNLNQ